MFIVYKNTISMTLVELALCTPDIFDCANKQLDTISAEGDQHFTGIIYI